jgi:hypothetical protein
MYLSINVFILEDLNMANYIIPKTIKELLGNIEIYKTYNNNLELIPERDDNKLILKKNDFDPFNDLEIPAVKKKLKKFIIGEDLKEEDIFIDNTKDYTYDELKQEYKDIFEKLIEQRKSYVEEYKSLIYKFTILERDMKHRIEELDIKLAKIKKDSK